MALDKEHILTKKEKAVMSLIFKEASKSDGVCLLRPVDIFQNLSYELNFEENELKMTLNALALDDYFEITETDKKGEFFYCISLCKKGLAYARTERDFKKSIGLKVVITIASSLIAVTVTAILRFVLSKLGIWK